MELGGASFHEYLKRKEGALDLAAEKFSTGGNFPTRTGITSADVKVTRVTGKAFNTSATQDTTNKLHKYRTPQEQLNSLDLHRYDINNMSDEECYEKLMDYYLKPIHKTLKEGGRVLWVSDYDGTLREFGENFNKAYLSKERLNALNLLSSFIPNLDFVIASARPLRDFNEVMEAPNCLWVAQHGAAVWDEKNGSILKMPPEEILEKSANFYVNVIKELVAKNLATYADGFKPNDNLKGNIAWATSVRVDKVFSAATPEYKGALVDFYARQQITRYPENSLEYNEAVSRFTAALDIFHDKFNDLGCAEHFNLYGERKQEMMWKECSKQSTISDLLDKAEKEGRPYDAVIVAGDDDPDIKVMDMVSKRGNLISVSIVLGTKCIKDNAVYLNFPKYYFSAINKFLSECGISPGSFDHRLKSTPSNFEKYATFIQKEGDGDFEKYLPKL